MSGGLFGFFLDHLLMRRNIRSTESTNSFVFIIAKRVFLPTPNIIGIKRWIHWFFMLVMNSFEVADFFLNAFKKVWMENVHWTHENSFNHCVQFTCHRQHVYK